jgi:Planctomycete cytochrome C
MYKKHIILIVPMIFLLETSCVHETDVNSLKSVSFSSDIQPLLAGNCTQSECHGTNSNEFPLVTYEDVMSNGDIKAGNAHDSKLYEVVSDPGVDEPMPPPPRLALSSDQLKLIYLWIEQGAKNN